MKVSRVGRVGRGIQILTALQSGQRYAVGDLAKMLEVSRRTIFRDLKSLQKAGVPCHCDCDKKTYYYAIDPKFFFLTPGLSKQEALGLLLLAHKARNYMHLPFNDSVLRAAHKIENTLPNKIKRYCNTVLQNISIKADPQARMNLLDKRFAQLQEAVLEKRVVNIHYYSPCEQKSIVSNLSPYHLTYNNHTWYVLGKSSLHKGIRTFKLNRIKKLDLLDKCFVKDEKFDVSEYLGKAWAMIPDGKLYNVKLRFLPEVAHNVAEVQWHNTQMVTFEEDGSAIVEFRVDGLTEISWWILGYGDNVQVLAPKVLRQKIIKIAQSMVKQNKRLQSV